MANAVDTIIEKECDKCKNKYTLSLDKFRRRERKGTPNYCPICMKEYIHEKQKTYFSSLSPEEQKEFKDKRNIYSRLSNEEKEAWSQRTKDQLANRTKEEQEKINKKNSEGLKKHWKTKSKKYRLKRTSNMRKGNRKYWDNMTPEERSENAKSNYNNIPEERRAEIDENSRNRMIEYNKTLSIEIKRQRAKNMEKWHKNLTKEEKKEFYKGTHQSYYDKSPEEKKEYAKIRSDYYYNLSPEEKEKISMKQREIWDNLPEKIKIERTRKKMINVNGKNNLHQKFERSFNESYLINDYYFKPEEVLSNNDVIHSWDYGIYNKLNNELLMVVDLDGAYFHADDNDYDGIHSKEEYDEKRSLSIPDNIKIFIIQEKNFSKSFELMIKELMMNYDEFIINMFKWCRSIPFPTPKYSNIELLKSYDKLLKMKTYDKYHKDINLNTRVGDRIINHFHESIWRAHRSNNISPYEAWQDDKLLMKVIKNRIIYQSYLNPNKILQGFNISKVATKVSVFSAGRAKMLINKYLNDCNEIFDPFSGFSGRMLGAISLGKRYIGQDISNIHVNESNNIIAFLKDKGIDINASIIQKDILESNGEYECLFTCPPYEDIEQWLDVPVSINTCDDWIDICLNNFKCKKYLFVVDYTEKYQEYIVDEISNRSHLKTDNSEYVILIER